jgi:hypothetical protein
MSTVGIISSVSYVVARHTPCRFWHEADEEKNGIGEWLLCQSPLQKEGMRDMRYTIVFVSRDARALSATDATTARQALAIVEALQSQDSEIKFIASAQEGEFGVEMLRLLAKEEVEEMPAASD